MLRKFVFLVFLSCLAIAFPRQLTAEDFAAHWYQPRLLPHTEDAVKSLQRLSPTLSPVTIEGNKFFLEKDHSFVSADANKSRIHLVFRSTRAGKPGAGGWTWDRLYDAASYSLDYKPGPNAIVTSLVFAEIGYFQIWEVPERRDPIRWCVVPIDRGVRHNDVLCAESQEDAQTLVDSLATLVRASGGSLTAPFGMWAKPGKAREIGKQIEQSGWLVSSIETEGPVAQSGIKPGDFVYRVNGKPCPGSGTFFQAYSEAAGKDLDGGEVGLEVLRAGAAMHFVLHYPPGGGDQK